MATIGFIAATKLLTSQGWDMENEDDYWHCRKDQWLIRFRLHQGKVRTVYLNWKDRPGQQLAWWSHYRSNPVLNAILYTMTKERKTTVLEKEWLHVKLKSDKSFKLEATVKFLGGTCIFRDPDAISTCNGFITETMPVGVFLDWLQEREPKMAEKMQQT